jgi:PTS system mannose-specific IIA component
MFGVLVVTHGLLARELVKAAETIVGSKMELMTPVSIGWNQEMEKARQKIESEVAKLDCDDGVIILTDMFGGTPTNISLTFLEASQVEVITGVNLPMLIKLASLKDEGTDCESAARLARDRGRQSIFIASEILNGQDPTEDR